VSDEIPNSLTYDCQLDVVIGDKKNEGHTVEEERDPNNNIECYRSFFVEVLAIGVMVEIVDHSPKDYNLSCVRDRA
jgi:hypothetical protein